MFSNLFKGDLLFYVIIGFVLLICLKVYSESDVYNLKCIISGVDGNKYCVREREKVDEAADLLANVTKKCKDLVKHMEKNHPNDERVKRLVNGFNPQKINETLPTSELTAYSENKAKLISQELSLDTAIQIAREKIRSPDEKIVVIYSNTEFNVTIL